MAQERKEGQWKHRYPEALEHGLSATCVAEEQDGQEGRQELGPSDWGIDSNATPAAPTTTNSANSSRLDVSCPRETAPASCRSPPSLCCAPAQAPNHYDSLIAQQDRNLALLQRQAVLRQHLEMRRPPEPTGHLSRAQAGTRTA